MTNLDSLLLAKTPIDYIVARCPVHQYADPTSPAARNLDLQTAKSIDDADAGLLFIDADEPRIEALREESRGWDDAQFVLCEKALAGDLNAFLECSRVISETIDSGD